jgi:hypothetical protein
MLLMSYTMSTHFILVISFNGNYYLHNPIKKFPKALTVQKDDITPAIIKTDFTKPKKVVDK